MESKVLFTFRQIIPEMLCTASVINFQSPCLTALYFCLRRRRELGQGTVYLRKSRLSKQHGCFGNTHLQVTCSLSQMDAQLSNLMRFGKLFVLSPFAPACRYRSVRTDHAEKVQQARFEYFTLADFSH